MKGFTKAVTSAAVLVLSMASLARANTTVMSCDLQNGRTVNVSWNGDNLVYQYGKVSATPELELPNNPHDIESMHFGHLSFAQGSAAYYRFTNGNYDYVTYFSELNNGDISNLGIFKDKKLIKQIKCKETYHTQLPSMYKVVDDKVLLDSDDDTDNWMVNEDDNSPSDSNAQNDPDNNPPSTAVEPSSTSPVKIQIQDIPSDYKDQTSANHVVNRHIYVYSLVDSVTINGVSVDRGSCYSWNTKPLTVAYGKRLDFFLTVDSQFAYANTGWTWYNSPGKKYNQCMWSEVVVKTNKGEWTFPLGQ